MHRIMHRIMVDGFGIVAVQTDYSAQWTTRYRLQWVRVHQSTDSSTHACSQHTAHRVHSYILHLERGGGAGGIKSTSDTVGVVLA